MKRVLAAVLVLSGCATARGEPAPAVQVRIDSAPAELAGVAFVLRETCALDPAWKAELLAAVQASMRQAGYSAVSLATTGGPELRLCWNRLEKNVGRDVLVYDQLSAGLFSGDSELANTSIEVRQKFNREQMQWNDPKVHAPRPKEALAAAISNAISNSAEMQKKVGTQAR